MSQEKLLLLSCFLLSFSLIVGVSTYFLNHPCIQSHTEQVQRVSMIGKMIITTPIENEVCDLRK